MTDFFFTLIKIAVGNLTISEGLTCAPSESEWKEALVTANKQTIVGVLLPTVEEINKVYQVPYNIWMQWNFFAEKIKEKNQKMNLKVIELGQLLEKDGFSYCILKGQGIAKYYPIPGLRTSGDIDVWMWPKKDNSTLKGRRKQIVRYVRDQFPVATAMYHHIDFPIFKEDHIEVEAHFTPSWMFSFRNNRRLQAFFESQSENQFRDNSSSGFNSPSRDFNYVYILNHIYRHLFDEGIGLRQLMDYYFVLANGKMSADVKSELVKTLKSLGLVKFAGAVMYVMSEVFGLKEEYAIAPVNKKEGSHLLGEIMASGNFGKFDTRKTAASKDESKSGKVLRRIRHSFNLAKRYPCEALSEMPFRVWQYCWRRLNHYV